MNTEKIKDALIKTFSSMLRTTESLSIGAEIENLIYDKDFNRIPANAGEGFSASDLKENIETIHSCNDIKPSLSIEPGGQIEFASKPYIQLKKLDHELKKYIKSLLIIAEEKKLILSDLAIEPILHSNTINIINQKKYKLMHKYFCDTGIFGHEMMLNSASIQINLDYTSLEQASKMAFIGDCLHPITSLMFSNAPFFRSKPSGRKNIREIVWRNTDPARSNCLLDHNISDIKTLIDDFCDYVLNIPVIFISDQDGFIETFAGNLESWLSSIESHRNIKTTDVLIALRQVFTQVRFKHILEIRGADRLPFGYEIAPAAFFKGLLRSPQIFDTVMSECKSWSSSQRNMLNATASTLNYNYNVFDGTKIKKLCEKFLLLAMDGLASFDEEEFLEPFAESFLNDGSFSLSIQKLFHKSGKDVKKFLFDRWLDQKAFLFDHTKN